MTEELEWKTRRERINKKLLALNPPWKIIKYTEGLDITTLHQHAVEEYPTANGPADYAFVVNGNILGFLEAKKVAVAPQNVLEQAKRYAKGAFTGPGNWNGYRVPFLYSSNGEVIWFLDVRSQVNISRTIANFHSPDALKECYGCDPAPGYAWLKTNPVDIEGLRPYQKEAIESIEEAII